MTDVIVTSAPCDFDPRLYNAMPDVQNADADIRRSGALERALAVMAPIFEAHDVTDFCGINLLHKHWMVDAVEIPLQIRRPHADAFELVTSPRRMRNRAATPSSWALRVEGAASRFVPFEFSTDAEVQRCAGLLEPKRAFFAAVGEALITHRLFACFGISIMPRVPLSDNPQARMVEMSSASSRASLVRPVEIEDTSALIQTGWMFSAGKVPKPTCQPVPYCDVEEVPIGPPYHRKAKSHDPD